MSKKNRPVKLPKEKGSPEKSLRDLEMFVLDTDLRAIAEADPESMPECLLVQACRQGNRIVNAFTKI